MPMTGTSQVRVCRRWKDGCGRPKCKFGHPKGRGHFLEPSELCWFDANETCKRSDCHFIHGPGAKNKETPSKDVHIRELQNYVNALSEQLGKLRELYVVAQREMCDGRGAGKEVREKKTENDESETKTELRRRKVAEEERSRTERMKKVEEARERTRKDRERGERERQARDEKEKASERGRREKDREKEQQEKKRKKEEEERIETERLIQVEEVRKERELRERKEREKEKEDEEREREKEGKTRARDRESARTEKDSEEKSARSPPATRARTKQKQTIDSSTGTVAQRAARAVGVEISGRHSNLVNGVYVPRAVAYPFSVGGMVYAKDDAPQPSDRAAVWVGMYLCKSFLRWVVCDLAHNLTEFAWSGEFGRAFPADVQKWIVDEGEGEGGERLSACDGHVMWRTRWRYREKHREEPAD